MLDINIKWTKTIHDAIIPPHPPEGVKKFNLLEVRG
jgi:hypothetical protein